MKAVISYSIGVVANTINTFDALITVHPQPAIKLEYVLPFEVFGDEALTTPIEAVEPFPLGVRVTNVGYGSANNFQIQSAQPQIVDNNLGLAVDFKLLSTALSGQNISNSFLIPFGNVAPQSVAQASWLMSSTLSGRFTNFASTFTHAADLGGQLTSLIQSVNTATLLKDVLIDVPGRDAAPDFLVNETGNRLNMQTQLDAGTQPPAEFVLESDQPVPVPVTEVPGQLSGTLGGTNAALTYTFANAVSPNIWVHSYAPFPAGSSAVISSARRSDGKILDLHNVWISKHFIKSSVTVVYWLNIFDLTASTASYTIQFGPAGLDAPPAAVADLNPVAVSSGGTIALRWTAPGEDGNLGHIVGGRYLIETAQSSSTLFSPASAQVNIATSTAPGNNESLLISNLIGNTTYFVRLWTQDTGGSISSISNGATAYTLPNPPTSLLFSAYGSTYAAANWQVGNNSLPVLYRVSAARTPGGVAVSSSPLLDPFNRGFVFGGLSPNTTFYFSGVGVNAGASSPISQMGSLSTLADPPSTGTLTASSGTILARWGFGADPTDTEFFVELSSSPGQLSYASGWVTGSSFTFTDIAQEFVYAGRVKARNRALIETAYAGLGTAAFSPLAVTLTPVDGSTVTTTTPAIVALYPLGVSTASVRLSLNGVDITNQLVVAASSVSFTPAGLFQGVHTATASVADLFGNTVSARSRFTVDSIAPVTALLVSGLTASATNLILVSTDTLGFTATDSGTGVFQTRYALDASTVEVVYGSTFSLTAGAHSLAYRSLDRAGNAEAVRNVAIQAEGSTVADTTAPAVALIFPSPRALGVERAVGGLVNIRGSVFDANLQSWNLAVAQGVAVSTTYTTLVSGLTNTSGLLFAWNTASLSGSYTLRLTATDTFGNIAVSTAAVFVGKPVIDWAVGRRNSNATVPTLKNPQGIVIRPDGRIWVAIDDDSRVILVTSSGALLATVGDGPGNQDKNGKLRFSHPRGLSLDGANNLYVTDRDNDRVVKLSSDGARVLAQFSNGLKDPNDAVIDVDGSLFVADTEHRRVRVFSSSGTVLRDIATGGGRGDSQPWGVALSTEGLWVSDRAQKSVYLFTRAGALLKTFPGMGRLRGAAVDHVEALYLVDRPDDRVSKFDPKGAVLLNFGPRSQASVAERNALKFLSDPADAAIGPDGSLWVADSGHDRIVRYVLPAPAVSHGAGMAALSGVGPAIIPLNLKAPAVRTLDAKDGGKIERDDGTGVRIPANALAASIELSVRTPDATRDAEAKRIKRLSRGIQPASDEVEYGPEGTAFSVPVTLTLAYDPLAAAQAGIKEEQLKVYYWNPITRDWEAVNTLVDAAAKTVSALTTHFSVYQVMGPGTGGINTAAADASFGFKAAYVFPNPARGTNLVTIRMQPGRADSLEVHVYDLSGRKIHGSSSFTNLGAYDDGNGMGPQFTYDHVWNVSGVASGVYTYVVTVKKAGESDIRRTGKIGIVK